LFIVDSISSAFPSQHKIGYLSTLQGSVSKGHELAASEMAISHIPAGQNYRTPSQFPKNCPAKFVRLLHDFRNPNTTRKDTKGMREALFFTTDSHR